MKMNTKIIVIILALCLLVTTNSYSKNKIKTQKKMENITEVTGIVTINGAPLTLLGKSVEVGDKAKDFTVTAQDMKDVKLSDYQGKTVIISTFPSIDTPVCALQAKTFNKKATELSDDVVILTISKDLPFALGRFCGAEGIDKVQALSDYKFNDFGLKYGFLTKEMQLLARGVVVIDKDGNVAYVEYVSDIKEEPNYDKVIEVIKKIK